MENVNPNLYVLDKVKYVVVEEKIIAKDNFKYDEYSLVLGYDDNIEIKVQIKLDSKQKKLCEQFNLLSRKPLIK